MFDQPLRARFECVVRARSEKFDHVIGARKFFPPGYRWVITRRKLCTLSLFPDKRAARGQQTFGLLSASGAMCLFDMASETNSNLISRA
jgi:hypothetical protein